MPIRHRSTSRHARVRSRTPIVVAFLVAMTLGAVSTAFGELITVGPVGSGCSQTTLTGALVRAVITPEADTIAITTDLVFEDGVALPVIDEENVTIGGVVSCTSFILQPRTITTTRADLLDFRGTNLTLRALRLESDAGGGRLVTATGSMLLTLDDTWVLNGKATNGGNLHLTDGASLFATNDSRINGGDATNDGGGIFCSQGGTVALGHPSMADGNESGNRGGGIYAFDCAVNILTGGGIASIRYGVVDNVAGTNGGGIYAAGGTSVIVAGTASHSASIVSNRANRGGGISVTGPSSEVLVWDAEVIGNWGIQGGGLYVTGGAFLEMDRTLAQCSRGIRCSLLLNNTAAGTVGQVEFGAGIAVDAGGHAELRQTYIAGNLTDGTEAGRVGHVDGTGSFLLLEGATLYDNDPRSPLLARNGSHLRLAFVSAWGSSTPGFGMNFLTGESNARIDLYSSLVIEGNGSAPTGGGPDRVFAPPGSGVTYNAECVIAHELDSFPAGLGFVARESNPAAIWSDPGAGDPHLSTVAPAIDACDTTYYTPVDLDVDDAPRGIDVAGGLNLGPYDLGADEFAGTPLPVNLFTDDFESGNTSAWSASVP